MSNEPAPGPKSGCAAAGLVIMVWSGLVWSGLVWSGLVWSGLVWSGLVWSGLVCSGLVWSDRLLASLARTVEASKVPDYWQAACVVHGPPRQS
jgi:hypothetical protein